ncbi:MAG: DUF2277 domain-containing protein [Actinobacteria bacterium]|nr:DUF2277 domain-containing protein [Actinomycetota bacterium]MBU1493030.1 DUF2277 domain-containing protein [Actinomycetota bacterium]MBU1866730.1 DUF2277 domain-containing protein [Actinomycetota bacterium]
MCRNIVRLRHPEAPAARPDMEAAALQYVRKVSGFRQPSRANREAFDLAVARIADATDDLLSSLVVRPTS